LGTVRDIIQRKYFVIRQQLVSSNGMLHRDRSVRRGTENLLLKDNFRKNLSIKGTRRQGYI